MPGLRIKINDTVVEVPEEVQLKGRDAVQRWLTGAKKMAHHYAPETAEPEEVIDNG